MFPVFFFFFFFFFWGGGGGGGVFRDIFFLVGGYITRNFFLSCQFHEFHIKWNPSVSVVLIIKSSTRKFQL